MCLKIVKNGFYSPPLQIIHAEIEAAFYQFVLE